MSVILENILKNVSLLSQAELTILLEEINQQMERAEKIRRALNAVRGKGQGVWQQDAQEYINTMRNNDERF